METVSTFPFSGKTTEIENVRMVIVKNYKLVYRISEELIEVITVWDGRRNPAGLKIT